MPSLRHVLLALTMLAGLLLLPSPPASALGTGDIVGTLTSAGGATQPYVTVTALGADGSVAATTTSGSDGTFRIATLQPGDYRLRASGGLVEPTDYGSDVTVVENRDTRLSGPFVVRLRGSLRGSLVTPTMAPAPYAEVLVYAVHDGVREPRSSQSGYGNNSGTFTVTGLESGSYQLLAKVQGYLPTWVGGTTESSTAATYVVEHDQATDAGTTTVVAGGAIAGTMRTSTGAPAAYSSVQTERRADDGTWSADGWAQTDQYGAFTIGGLEAGLVRVSGRPDGVLGTSEDVRTYWPSSTDPASAQLVTVTRGETTTLPTALASVRGGSITGRVTVASGDLRFSYVRAERRDPTGEWVTVANDFADDGTYRMGGLAAGAYRVVVYGSGLADTWWGGPDAADADLVQVAEATETAGIDIRARRPGQVSGRVVGPDGSRISSVAVYAYPVGVTDSSVPVVQSTTDSQGNYLLAGLQPVDYQLRFVPRHQSGYATVWYGDHVIDRADSPAVRAVADEVVYDVIQVLGARPVLSGTTRTTAGTAVAGTVEAYELSESGWSVVASTRSTAAGDFSLTLEPGRYRLRFKAPSTRAVWSGGAATLDGATTVALAADQTQRFDPVATVIGRLVGRVLDDDGRPSTRRTFTVALWTRDAAGQWGVADYASAPGGDYAFPGIEDQPYKLQVLGYQPYADTWVGGSDLASATVVPGSATGTVTAPDVQMVSGQVVTTITAPTVSGVPHVAQELVAEDGTYSPGDAYVEYEWLVDGVVDGRDKRYYVPQSAYGKTLSLRVRGTRADSRSAVTTLDVGRVDDLQKVGRILLTGTPVVGGRLAYSGTWTVTPDAYEFTWMRDGETIVGAHGPTYRPVAADVGKRIRLYVGVSKATYNSAGAYSNIAAATTTPGRVTASATSLGRGRAAVTGKVYAAGVSVVTGRVSVLLGSKVLTTVALGGSRFSAKVTGLRPGRRTLTVKYLGGGSTLAAVRTVTVRIR